MSMRIGALVLLARLLFAAGASALSFSAGDVSVTDLTEYGFINTPAGNEALSFDSGSTDELYEYFGYIGNRNGIVRIDGSNFSVTSGLSQTGNAASASLSLNAAGASVLGLAANDLLIDHTFTLIDDTSAADSDEFRFDVTLTNDSGWRQNLRYYSYLDIDLTGSFADDTASGDQSGIVVSDASSMVSWFTAGGANHYEVDSYGPLKNKLDGWTRARNLADSGTPFGPADFTGAQQINANNLSDQAYQFMSWRIVKGPEPRTAFMLGLGLAILGLMGRRPR